MLSIVLTTFNRPQHLRRLLDYFSGFHVKYPIYIGDASESTHLERNERTVGSVSKVLNVRHLVYDNSTDTYEVGFRCLEQVNTRYVVWVHDDDFVVPRALDAVVKFMDRNPSYEAAQGKQIAFRTSSGGAYSTSLEMAPLNMVDFSVEGVDARDRIRKRITQNTMFAAPKTVYSVMRAPTALRLYTEVLALGLDHSNTEAVMNQMVLLSGNIKLINRLYIGRQHYRSNNSYHGSHHRYTPVITRPGTGESYEPLLDMRRDKKILQRPDFFDLLVDPLFHIKYERMITCLSNELSRQDGIGVDESREIIKRWQWYFLAKNMMLKFCEQTGYQPNAAEGKVRPISRGLRQWLRHVPGVAVMQQKLLALGGGKMSAAALLRPNLTFYNDLKPICCAVITSPEAGE